MLNSMATQKIRELQQAEGNEPCFNSKVLACQELCCCWREICQPVVHVFEVTNEDRKK